MKNTKSGLVVDLAASRESSITILTLENGEQILTTLTPKDMEALLRKQMTNAVSHYCMNYTMKLMFSGGSRSLLNMISITTSSSKHTTKSTKGLKGARISKLGSLMTEGKLKL